MKSLDVPYSKRIRARKEYEKISRVQQKTPKDEILKKAVSLMIPYHFGKYVDSREREFLDGLDNKLLKKAHEISLKKARRQEISSRQKNIKDLQQQLRKYRKEYKNAGGPTTKADVERLIRSTQQRIEYFKKELEKAKSSEFSKSPFSSL